MVRRFHTATLRTPLSDAPPIPLEDVVGRFIRANEATNHVFDGNAVEARVRRPLSRAGSAAAC